MIALRESESVWMATSQLPVHPSLAFNVRVDVAVIGGGITGATAAYLLKQAGYTVALIDRARCGFGETGRSAGHLSTLPDMPLRTLVDRIGIDAARSVWDAGFMAMARIRAIVRDERINCGFAWVPGVLHAGLHGSRQVAVDHLRRELDAAEAIGIGAEYVDELPGLGAPGLVFEGQARLHPLNYLGVVVDRIPGAGCYVFEDTAVDAVEGQGPFVIRSGEYRIACRHLVGATHVPADLPAGADIVAPLGRSRSYVVSGIVDRSELDEGVYWTLEQADYDYLRVDRFPQHDEVSLGGGDHPADREVDRQERYGALASRLAVHVPGVSVMHRWSGCVVESSDGLPIIGEVAPGQVIATGFGGNGLTYGTLGGMMAADLVAGRSNPWTELFRPRARGVRGEVGEPIRSLAPVPST